MTFLLTYDKSREILVNIGEFTDDNSEAAELERQVLEAEHRGNDLIEIVLLRSNDLNTLKQTHSRYFFTSAQIAENLRELAK